MSSKVLLVEDDTDAREAITELLAHQGLEVLATDEGRKALELMEAWRPALVLLDLHMPGMNGREFRAEQKRRARLARIPVVVITGAPDPSFDADEMLTKPFKTDDLMAVVARYVPRVAPPAVARPVV